MFSTGNKTFFISLLLVVCLNSGCKRAFAKNLFSESDLGATIGSVADVLSVKPLLVGGYGVAGNLNGRGSVDCPPYIRTYLRQYILRQVTDGNIDVDKLINSADTAVVLVEGIIPASPSKGQRFDLRVMPLGEKCSLEDGWLYSAELMPSGRFVATTKPLATAEGPICINTIDKGGTGKRIGYIPAGGTVPDEYRMSVVLREKDYRMISSIRNQLNERFSDAEANAVSPSRIVLFVPAKYKERKDDFISILKAMYLEQTPELTSGRIMTFVRDLAVLDDKKPSEIALEAIGRVSVGKLRTLLNSSNEETRFRAARCILNLGSDKGLRVLVETAVNEESPYRVEAIKTISRGARRNEAIYLCQELLSDPDFNMRLLAYEQLVKLEDVTLDSTFIGGSFYLDQIKQTKYQTIYVSRSGLQRIALFGAPIYCRDNILVRSADGDVIIYAPAGQKYVSLFRKHPKRPVLIGPLRSSFSVGDIIQVLCEEPVEPGRQGFGGLGVSYADMISLLKQMCDRGIVRARFQPGAVPKFD